MRSQSSDYIDNYSGSTALHFLCDITSLQMDMVNFVFCQLVALGLSYFMRKRVRNAEVRLWYTLVCGIAICTFCYGAQILHIIISGAICYLIMNSTQSKVMPWLVFAASMGYLTFLHIKRQFFDQTLYAIDITGPFMVLTQKLTALAFARQDGVSDEKKDGELTPLQKQRLVSEIPSPLVFCSFVFQFQSMLAGPLVFYDDYTEFIYDPVQERESSPAVDVTVKLFKSVFFAMVFLGLGSALDVQRLRSAEFLEQNSAAYLMVYILLSTSVERCKYYHAWLLADGVCNLSGLGYDRSKKTWDKVSNVHPFRLEKSLNLKELLDNWNIQTMKWLRFTIYERAPVNLRTNLVYITSAFWHGFLPGYYITFTGGALFTAAGRSVRKYLRPYFLENNILKVFYDALTLTVTRFLLAYVTFSFVLGDFYPSIAVFIRIYFFMHIIGVLCIYLLPFIGKKSRRSIDAAEASKSTRSNRVHQNGIQTAADKELKTLGGNLNDGGAGAGTAKLKTG